MKTCFLGKEKITQVNLDNIKLDEKFMFKYLINARKRKFRKGEKFDKCASQIKYPEIYYQV